MDLDRKPRRKSGYRLEMMDGELLLFHPVDTRIIYCNDTASVIWQLCNGEHTVEEIIELLSDAYPEAASRLSSDVVETLEEFQRFGAIETS